MVRPRTNSWFRLRRWRAPEGSTLPGGRVFDFSIVDQDEKDVDLRGPVILRLPYEEGLDPVDVAVLDWNEALRRWESIDVVEVDEATNTVAVEIEHLSNKKVMEYLEPLRFHPNGRSVVDW